jgi:hypothetical protein
MTRPVRREEILDYVTYDERRGEIQKKVFEMKTPRRVHVGDHLTFLFENTDTMRYQIQEMIRAEKIVKESAIQHEIDTYNAMLGGPGELGCALLIEIAEADQRKPLLEKWLGLQEHLYVELEDGRKVYATYDADQVGDDRLSAVQYLKFDTHGEVPVKIGTDFFALAAEATLTAEQRAALTEDLEDAPARA